MPGATWGLAGSSGFSCLVWSCSGTLERALVSVLPVATVGLGSLLHIAACSTWDEVWSLEVADPRSHPPTHGHIPCGRLRCHWFLLAVLRPWPTPWVELHKTGAQPLQTSLFLFSTSTVLVHSFPPQRPGCLPSHFGAHKGKQTRYLSSALLAVILTVHAWPWADISLRSSDFIGSIALQPIVTIRTRLPFPRFFNSPFFFAEI